MKHWKTSQIIEKLSNSRCWWFWTFVDNKRQKSMFSIFWFSFSMFSFLFFNVSASSFKLKCLTYLFFGMLNQYSGRNLFLPYDITVVGSGVDFPLWRPIRSRRYIGGSWHARAGLGISSANFVCVKYIGNFKGSLNTLNKRSWSAAITIDNIKSFFVHFFLL